MRNKIFANFLLLSVGSILLTLLLCVVVMYSGVSRQVRNDLRQDAVYVAQGLAGDKKFLATLPKQGALTRITLVDAEGKVLYDNMETAATMPDHGGREEIVAAVRTGSGSSVRHSETLDKEIYYYAQRLPDGRILRVARSADSSLQVGSSLAPLLVLGALVLGLLAYFLARRLAGKLVAPLETINLDHPLAGEAYDELAPFLRRIDKQNRELQAAAALRREFTANVSHELKTPLQSISGYAEIIGNGIAKPEDVPRFVGKISDESRRLIDMVDNLMKLARLDEQVPDAPKEALDLAGLVDSCCQQLAEQARVAGIKLSVAVPPACEYTGVRRVLEEIVFNLVENAIKYNHPGGRVEVQLTCTGHPVLQVRDTGMGIKPEDKERIFERFYRGEKSHANIIPGNGLGLALVKHGVQLHGGEVTVNSEPGRGTLMTVRL